MHTVLGRGSQYRPIYCESGVSSTLMITSYRGRQNPILTAVTQNQCSQVKLWLLSALSLLVNTSLDLEIISRKKKKVCCAVMKSAGIELSLHNTTGLEDFDILIIISLILHYWHIYYNLQHAHRTLTSQCLFSACHTLKPTEHTFIKIDIGKHLILLTHSTWTWNRKKIRVTWHDNLPIHSGHLAVTRQKRIGAKHRSNKSYGGKRNTQLILSVGRTDNKIITNNNLYTWWWWKQ
jgi:hypothetical protein